jgi:uncharacterized repeat protein (TIGR03803 family)
MSKTCLSFYFAAVICASAAGQNNFKVIHSFSGYPNDGLHPVAPVVFDNVGNMYGTSPGGGSNSCDSDNGCGVVYELSPNQDGSRTETILYNFCANFDGLSCLDGAFPGAGLAIDASGNLYGMTELGGTGDEPGNGGGVAFKLSPPTLQGGAWTEAVLYNFCSDFVNNTCLDGGFGLPSQPVLDANGNLYGTTALGGTGHVSRGAGVVFKLSPGSGGWTETVLYNFCSQGQGDECPDGYQPGGGVTFDKSGSLYGTTSYSGNVNSLKGGTLFELSQGGKWKYKLLASIPANAQPSIPEGPISFDSAGNIYSTLAIVYGGVFRIDPRTKKLSLFAFNQKDGYEPLGGVYVDSQRAAIYGTNSGGVNGPGNIFAINADGKETVLYKFCTQPSCTDGSLPWATLVPDAKGNLYGTTEFGGDYGAGVVFEITP